MSMCPRQDLNPGKPILIALVTVAEGRAIGSPRKEGIVVQVQWLCLNQYEYGRKISCSSIYQHQDEFHLDFDARRGEQRRISFHSSQL